MLLYEKSYPSGNGADVGDISLRLFRSGTDKHRSKTAGENAGAHHTTWRLRCRPSIIGDNMSLHTGAAALHARHHYIQQ